MLGETSSPSSNTAKTKHTSSTSDRRSASHALSAVTTQASTSQTTTAAISAVPMTVDRSGSGAMKGKNVCVVEPQSTIKATAVVAPLVAESRQFTELFGEPIVTSDVPKKHHQHKVCWHSPSVVGMWIESRDPGTRKNYPIPGFKLPESYPRVRFPTQKRQHCWHSRDSLGTVVY